MATIGRTLFRFAGALMLGVSAMSIDNPGVLLAPTVERIERLSVLVTAQVKPPARVAPAVASSGLEVRITPGRHADFDPELYRRRIVRLRQPPPRALPLRGSPSPSATIEIAPVVTAPAPKPARPDSFALKVFRGTTKAEEIKFAEDSAARADSLQSLP